MAQLSKQKIAEVISLLVQGKMCKEVEDEADVSHPVLTKIREDLPLLFWNNRYTRGNRDGVTRVKR